MPIIVKRLPNEPILIATFTGYITIDDIKEMYHASAALIGDETRVIHRISDTRAATTNFLEMIKIVQTATQDTTFSSMDQHIQVTYVGTSTWINFARDIFAKRGVPMAAFEDIESALESVRFRIAAETGQAPVS